MLPEADYSMTQQAMSGVGGQQPKLGSRNFVQFYNDGIENEKESLAQGRPVFREVTFIKIMIPGNKSEIIERKMRDTDKQEYPMQYQAFMNGVEEPVDGMPLKDWAPITRSQVMELAHFGCKTVEQLAGMADSNAQNFMAIMGLRQKARDWLEEAEKHAPVSAIRAENDQLRNQMAALQDQMDQMVAAQKEDVKKPAPARRATSKT